MGEINNFIHGLDFFDIFKMLFIEELTNVIKLEPRNDFIIKESGFWQNKELL